jgi:hypothetical protein
MAVTFQSQTGGSGTGNFTPSYPSGVATDDLIIIHVCYEKGSDVNFAGAGSSQWTWIDRADNSTNIGIRVGYLKYDGTTLSQINLSGGPKYTWTTARYDGQDTTSPIDQNANANGSSGNPNPPSITPTVSPTLAIICAGNKKAPTGTPPSGYTERWDRANTTDSLSWTYGAEKALSDTSAEDPGNVTASETEAWGAITFNVKEAAITDRDVTCTTETLTLTENAATVNKERGVNCTTEVLTLTENAATVNKQRGVNCTTEVLTLTENAATIDIGFTTIETAYFDASYSGPTDPDAVWTDDANAFDGSTATEAETGTAGTISTNELTGQGHTTSSAKWDNVLHARTRVYTSRTGTATGFWYLYDQAGSWQYSNHGYSNPAPTWSPWLTVEEKFGGWTKDDFEQLNCLNFLSSGSGTVHSYRAEIEWTYAPNLNFSNYRIDASDAGPTDAQAVWTDDANAFDNIRPTFASLAVNNNGSSTNNALVAEGTNAPGSGPPISVVYARSLFTKGSYDSLKAEIYTDGKGELLGTIDDTDRFEWFELTAPSGGWTWAKVQALEAYLYGTGYVSGASVGRAYFVEVKVGYDGRRVDCSTEVITLTEATATINASRDVNCTTEVLTFTEATATVNASRKVTCSTEVLTLTSNKAALFTATETVYMDASVSGPTDPDAAWTNDSNAFDGSTSTYAVTTTAGDIDVNELQGKGHTTVNAAWNTVVNSRARVYGHKVSGSLGRSLLWDGISVFNVYFIGNFPDSLGWSSWVPLFEPKPGWSQTVFDELVDTSYVTGTTPELRWYRTEVEWTYRTDLEFVDVYYFDASDEGPTDSQSVWTLESSAFDDLQTSNAAQLATGNNGSSTNNALSGGGTNAPASGGTIVACYARWAATKGDYAELHGEIYTNGKSELLETLSTTDNNVDPKDWIELAVPSGGWTWAKVQALEIYCYGTGHVSGSGSGASRLRSVSNLLLGAPLLALPK